MNFTEIESQNPVLEQIKIDRMLRKEQTNEICKKKTAKRNLDQVVNGDGIALPRAGRIFRFLYSSSWFCTR